MSSICSLLFKGQWSSFHTRVAFCSGNATGLHIIFVFCLKYIYIYIFFFFCTSYDLRIYPSVADI